MRLAVTGGAGFIGSNFVHYWMREHAGDTLVVVDKLTYAGNLANLEPLANDARLRFVHADISDAAVADALAGCDAVVHLAAETHVDRSIEDAGAFVRTNVEGTYRLIESCRAARIARFVHVSTDEVYGSIASPGKFDESSALAPTSPYAASKAASDLLVQAYVRTHRFPAVITRCSNNYGPYQFPEKFIPLMIAQALEGKPLPVYGDGLQVRDWIHVEDHCRALDAVLRRGREGEVYCVGGNCEMRNLDVARLVVGALGRDASLIEFVADRPAHDRRYAIDSAKVERELGWKRQWDFERGLASTIRWYRENAKWLALTRSGAYREYFQRHYQNRPAALSARDT